MIFTQNLKTMNKFLNVLIFSIIIFLSSCSENVKLSPVDISDSQKDLNLKPLFDDYSSQDSLYISNEVNYLAISGYGNYIVIPSEDDYQGLELELSKVLIKSPSEHTIKGEAFDLELQFIHSDSIGNNIYIAVFVKQGKENKEFDKIIANIPKNNKLNIITNLDFYHLFQQNPSYWKYTGSSTNKPYIENVKWYIMQEPIEASESQINQIVKIIGKHNNKQVDIGERIIYEY